MKKLELNQMEIVEGGKFFGRETISSGCVDGFTTLTVTYYAFWVGYETNIYMHAC